MHALKNIIMHVLSVNCKYLINLCVSFISYDCLCISLIRLDWCIVYYIVRVHTLTMACVSNLSSMYELFPCDNCDTETHYTCSRVSRLLN